MSNPTLSAYMQSVKEIKNTAGTNAKIELCATFMKQMPFFAKSTMQIAKDPQVSTFISKFKDISNPIETTESLLTLIENQLKLVMSLKRVKPTEWQEFISKVAFVADDEQLLFVKQLFTGKLDMSIGLSGWNKAVKKLGEGYEDLSIRDFKCLKCTNLPDAKINYRIGAFLSTKKDGVNGDKTLENVFLSRTGNPMPMVHLEEATKILVGKYAIFGELCSEGENRQKASSITGSVIKMGYESDKNVESLVFHVFDAMYAEEWESQKFTTKFVDRIEIAREAVALADSPYIQFLEHDEIFSEEEAYRINAELVKKSEEGVIVNDRNAVFQFGKHPGRGRIKEVIEAEFVITGFKDHKKNADQIGSIYAQTTDGLCRFAFGSGFSEELTKDMRSNPDKYIGKVMKGEYNGVIETKKENTLHPYTLFLGIFKEMRWDKPIADSTYDIGFGKTQTYKTILATAEELAYLEAEKIAKKLAKKAA